MAKKVNKTENPKKEINYAQVFARKEALMDRIRRICPEMKNTSGIYTFHKIDENGFKKYYSGQARHLCERTSAHLSEYDHIALSLKKYGFKKEGNPYGWELEYFYCPINELDQKEQETIAHWHIDLGYIPYNKTGGKQGKGKFGINENKPTKTYRDGIVQGTKSTKAKVKVYFTKYLDYSIKQPPTKIKERKFAEFREFLEDDEGSSE